MSVHTDKMTHAVTCIIEESLTVRFKKFGSAEKLAVNMSAEIQPKKNTASRNLSRIFPKPAILQKNLA